MSRKTPIGAEVTVDRPRAREIIYTVTLELVDGRERETVLEAFRDALATYYVEAKKGKEVKYTRVWSILTDIPGVLDFRGLLLDGGQKNIPIAEDECPATGIINADTGEGVRS